MELSPPISIEISKGIINKREKSFQIESNKKNFANVIIKNCSSHIKLCAKLKQNNQMEKEFENIYYLKDLKANKFLNICDSIDEIYEQLVFEFGKENNKKCVEQNKEIIIIISVEHIKVKEIQFRLIEKVEANEELFQNEINYLKKEVNLLKESNKILKSGLENDINKLKEEKNNLENDIKFIKKENKKIKREYFFSLIILIIIILVKFPIKRIEEPTNKKFKLYQILFNFFEIVNFESSIINNDVEKKIKIFEWIIEKANKNIQKFELIFKMSVNGNRSEDFYKYCENQGPTLLIIKTTNNNIFGGFTPLNWEKDFQEKMDQSNQTFIFSLNLLKKFDMIDKKKCAIRCGIIDGPIFGDCDLGLNTNMSYGVTYANKKCNFFSDNNLILTGKKGEKDFFLTKEIEVYKVIFD